MTQISNNPGMSLWIIINSRTAQNFNNPGDSAGYTPVNYGLSRQVFPWFISTHLLSCLLKKQVEDTHITMGRPNRLNDYSYTTDLFWINKICNRLAAKSTDLF